MAITTNRKLPVVKMIWDIRPQGTLSYILDCPSDFEAQRIIDLRGMVIIPSIEVFAEAMCKESEKINIDDKILKRGYIQV